MSHNLKKLFSISIAGLIALVLALPARAALITPVSATSSNSAYNGGDASKLLGPGFTENDPIETSTHTNLDGTLYGWTPLSSTTPRVDFDLGGTYTVGEAHIWNLNYSYENVSLKWGMEDVRLIFSQDATFGNGDDTNQTLTLSVASNLSTYTGEHFTLTPVANVTHIRLEMISKLTPADGVAGLSEVRFSSAVPEPSSFALAALGLAGLGWFGILRRRKK